jgi:hypothetical protein
VKRAPIAVVAAAMALPVISAHRLAAEDSPVARHAPRAGRVRLVDHALADDQGPFLGLGASYFTALWRCKYDRPRLESDLAFLSKQGFNYIRMLSMVGHHPSWAGREIAPVTFRRRDGSTVAAWQDYWEQLRTLVDLAFDRFGLRTQITVFADAQLMPDKRDRIVHMQTLLNTVVAGREHKVVMLEVANEAWQNGFPEEQGVADLREFATFLDDRTDVLVAITSNHDGPGSDVRAAFQTVYQGASADVATWHFTRDRRTDDGWKPVYDCWELGNLPGYPPLSSNEPIGPGSSVNAERDPARLVMAAAFAYTAKLPMYVFHSEAGVAGKGRFEDMPGVDQYGPMMRLLPSDLPNWTRFDGQDAAAPFTTFAAGLPNRYAPDVETANDGCVRHVGSRQRTTFVCVPIGIRPDGLQLAARHDMRMDVYHPLTAERLSSAVLRTDETITLPPGPGALLIRGELDWRR